MVVMTPPGRTACNFTTYAPGQVYVWVTTDPTPALPSPKSHSTDVPAGSTTFIGVKLNLRLSGSQQNVRLTSNESFSPGLSAVATPGSVPSITVDARTEPSGLGTLSVMLPHPPLDDAAARPISAAFTFASRIRQIGLCARSPLTIPLPLLVPAQVARCQAAQSLSPDITRRRARTVTWTYACRAPLMPGSSEHALHRFCPRNDARRGVIVCPA